MTQRERLTPRQSIYRMRLIWNHWQRLEKADKDFLIPKLLGAYP